MADAQGPQRPPQGPAERGNRQAPQGHPPANANLYQVPAIQDQIPNFAVANNRHETMYLKGVLDNEANVHAWLGRKSVYNTLIFKTVNIQPFMAPYAQQDVINMGHILCFGRMLAEGGRESMSSTTVRDARLLLIGEIMTPVKPTGMDAPTDEARRIYVNAVSSLRQDTNITYICDATRAGFNEWGGSDAEWEENPLRTETAIKLMTYFGTCHMTAPPLNPVAMLTYAFVAMSKRGAVTEKFCAKVVNGIRADVGASITMMPDTISTLWAYYGDVMDDLVANTLFANWKEELPNNALRLRITLEQTLNTGLTTLTVTVRGMTDHPTFPWNQLVNLTPYNTEMIALKRAILVVGDNKYYGYRKDLGDAKGTLYKNLLYVAKELLIKVNGETDLSSYGGFPKRPAQAPTVNAMIEAYINKLHAYGQDPTRYPLDPRCTEGLYLEICNLRIQYASVYQHATST